MALQWFRYSGSNPASPSSFTKHGSSAPTNCGSTSQQLCAIQTEEDSNSEPVLDVDIALEMANALQNQTNTSNVLLKAR